MDAAPKQTPEHHAEVTFARTLGLFDAVMLGLGAMIGAGIYVLVGIAIDRAGPAVLLAFALNGVVALCTAFSFAELSSAIHEAGGGYSYIRRAFPAWVGFTGGWVQWFAYTVSGALYALGFSLFFWQFVLDYFPAVYEFLFTLVPFWPSAPVALVTVLIALVFFRLNYRGSEVTGRVGNLLTVGKVLVLLVFIGFGTYYALQAPQSVLSAFMPFFAKGGGGVLVAMGLTFIAFKGYDLIATLSEEVQEPEKNIPRAIYLTLGIGVVIYLALLVVMLGAYPVGPGEASWQVLGAKGATALVAAAQAFMPGFGAALLVAGGLFAFTSALNAMVLAASRTAYALGRARMLPGILSAIHPASRTPYVSIIVTGAIVLGVAVALDATTLGSAASIMFLLLFAMVNLSAIVLRADRSVKRRFSTPLYPWPTLIGLITSLLLVGYQLQLGKAGMVSLALCGGWIVGGLALYFALFHREALKLLPQVIAPYCEYPLKLEPVKYRVMVPVCKPGNVAGLVGLACQLVKPYGAEGEVVAVSVIEVPEQLDIQQGLSFAHNCDEALALAEQLGREQGVRLRTEVRIAHKTPQAILQLARKEKVQVLVLGWKGFSVTGETVFSSVVDDVITYAPCDLFLVKCSPAFRPPFKQILLPTAGGPSARYAATLVHSLLAPEGRVVLAGVAREGAGKEQLARVREGIGDTIAEMEFEVPADRKLLKGDSVPQAVSDEARTGEYDLVIVGATNEPWLKRAMFGEIPEKIARQCYQPLMLVKHHLGAKTWINRFLGR